MEIRLGRVTPEPNYAKIVDRYDGSPRPWRGLTSMAGFLTWLFASASWLGTLAWAAGEIVSDRYSWSQWLEWIPTLFVLVGSSACLLAAWAAAALRDALRNLTLAPLGEPSTVGEKKAGRAARLLLRCGWYGWCLTLVYFFISETPFYKPTPPPPAFNQDSFRLASWNSGGEERPGWDRALGATNADILVLNGLRSSATMSGLRPLIDSGASVIQNERFLVISKRRILRWGATSLAMARGAGLDPRQETGSRPWIDRGRALFFQFESTDSPPILRTAWVIDLPSDLSLSRAEVTARAHEVIHTFPGKAYVLNAAGAWVPEPAPGTNTEPSEGPGLKVDQGFPPPDLITGDFNIPRGSWSLEILTRGLTSAYDQAARRYCASWPRPYPFLHLDQTFLAPGLRAWSYALREPGSAEHLVQVVDVTVRERD